MRSFKIIVPAVGGTIFLWLMLNLFIGGGLLHWKFWSAQYRDAQTEIFQQSQSYVQGKITHITRLQLDYQSAEEGSTRHQALRRTILTEAATVDNNDLPEHLQIFIDELSDTP